MSAEQLATILGDYKYPVHNGATGLEMTLETTARKRARKALHRWIDAYIAHLETAELSEHGSLSAWLGRERTRLQGVLRAMEE